MMTDKIKRLAALLLALALLLPGLSFAEEKPETEEYEETETAAAATGKTRSFRPRFAFSRALSASSRRSSPTAFSASSVRCSPNSSPFSSIASVTPSV